MKTNKEVFWYKCITCDGTGFDPDGRMCPDCEFHGTTMGIVTLGEVKSKRVAEIIAEELTEFRQLKQRSK